MAAVVVPAGLSPNVDSPSFEKLPKIDVKPLVEDSLLASRPKFELAPQVSIKSIPEDNRSEASDDAVNSLICAHAPVRSTYHREAVSFRSDIQVHLRSVQKTSDDMLFKIREIVESLDRATHEKLLHKEQYDGLCQRYKDITARLEISTQECVTLRARLYEMSKARDRAEIELEALSGHLLEKEHECAELREETSTLHKQIVSMEATLVGLTSRLVEAEATARIRLEEYNAAVKELEILKASMAVLFAEKETLATELAITRMKFKEVSSKLEVVKQKFISIEHKCTALETELKSVREELIKAKEARDKAITERKDAIHERDIAVQRMDEAIEDRNGAIRARDGAIFDYQSAKTELIRDQAMLKDCQLNLETLQKRFEIVIRERDYAVHNQSSLEHYRDELVEQFKEADSRAHGFKFELEKATEARQHAENEVQATLKKMEILCHDKDVIVLEREQLYLQLKESEARRNEAIAKESKAFEELLEATQECTNVTKEYEDMEDKFQKADKERAILDEKLKIIEADLKAAKVKEALMADQLEHTKADEIKALRERNEMFEKLSDSEELSKTLKQQKDDMEKKLEAKIKDLEGKLAQSGEDNIALKDKVVSLEKSYSKAVSERNEKARELEDTKHQAADQKNKLDKEIVDLKDGVAKAQKKEHETEKMLQEKTAELEKEKGAMKNYAGNGEVRGNIWVKNINYGTARLPDTHKAYKMALDRFYSAKTPPVKADNKFIGFDPNVGVQKTLIVRWAQKDKEGKWDDKKALSVLERGPGPNGDEIDFPVVGKV
ncbi:uncharacterized protein Z519_08901 [Cladophialophora bantiana CBS 173.52]|uniref:Uncharacterized protein n=1 Tax=Cladophialophora bantiana (strain ATCC 10958 / CBS 173.52 / CDC B-1940 / NIH 8579) TaxID=1442370 RepID=A0A0D2FUM9_CLAB1|nr:uncharacterized protein Z519_08901 [Cladophialophora bantiana CBS 173.52]KIW90257.1 hypothetical protein Z519_08901 [Cladophialophora bantiana CBS 173.52]